MIDNTNKKLLLITPCSFHDTIMHAGGKSINFYFSQFYSDENLETAILCLNDFDSDFEKMQNKFNNSLIIYDAGKKSLLRRVKDYFFINYLYDLFKNIIPFYYISNGFYKRRLTKLINSTKHRYHPDIIVVEYTSVIVFGKIIKDAFPGVKMIASCHDIVFQSIERKFVGSKLGFLKKWYINTFKKLEKAAVSNFDIVTVPSIKDAILINENLNIPTEKIQVITLFYDKYKLDSSIPKDGILFYGFMRREENFLSVIWFLENVWNIVKANLPDLKLYILGGGATEQLISQTMKYKDVILTGFIPDPTLYFSKSLAMIAPLQFGAGVKVKSLEAMASGLPLIANNIAIEGINAKEDIDYLHCESPEEWVIAIKRLFSDGKLRQLLIDNAKLVIDNNYSPYNSFVNLKNRILEL